MRRVFHRHHVFGDPLLEPEQRSEIGSPAADLLEEAREERRCQVGSAVHERRQPARDVARERGGEQARHPLVGGGTVGHVARGAQRHPANALEIPHAQHGRNRPELAERERRDALILGDHARDAAFVETAVRVGDQLDDDVVDAWESRARPVAGELRQLSIVCGRKRRPNLGNLLEDDEEVVEQPGARRSHVGAGGRRLGEGIACGDEDLARRVEAREQRAAIAPVDPARSATPADRDVAARQLPGVRREPRRAEQRSLHRTPIGRVGGRDAYRVRIVRACEVRFPSPSASGTTHEGPARNRQAPGCRNLSPRAARVS